MSKRKKSGTESIHEQKKYNHAFVIKFSFGTNLEYFSLVVVPGVLSHVNML